MAVKYWSLKNQPMSQFQGMKFPTLLNDFQVKKVDTERVSTVQIYLQKIMIASKQLVKQRKIYSHI